MTVYAKMRSNALVLPSTYSAGKPLGSIYVDGPSLNVLTFRDYTSTDIPIIGGTVSSTEVLIKRKRNLSGIEIPADSVVALKTDGSICLAESDVPSVRNNEAVAFTFNLVATDKIEVEGLT